MPPKKSAGQGSKPALTPTGRLSRKGRFTALPRKVPVDEEPYRPENEFKVEGLASASQEVVTTSTSSILQSQTSQDVTKSTQLSSNGVQPVTVLSRPDPITEVTRIPDSSAVEVPMPTSQSSDPRSDRLERLHSVVDSKSDPLSGQLHIFKAPKLPRLTTPEIQPQARSDSLSSLSTVPESLGNTPEGFTARQQCLRNQTTQGASPIRRSSRARKRSITTSEPDIIQSPQKRRKITKQTVLDILPSIEESPAASSAIADAAPSGNSKRSTTVSTDSLATKRRNHDSDFDIDSSTQPRNKRLRISDEGYGTLSPDKSLLSTSQTLPCKPPNKALAAQEARDKRYKARLAKEVLRSESTAPVRRRRSDRNKVVTHGSDAQTQHNSAPTAEPARRGGKTNGRGAARGGRGGAGGGKGRSNKGRGRGRDEDSPEPPHPKKPQSQEDATIIRQMKARQVELRKFFTIVGNQQGEILDVISSQHLTRIVKKAKTHKQVPEHDEIVQQLEDLRDFRQDLVRKEYELAVAAEMARFEAEKEVLGRSLKTQVGDLQEEYTKGAQGDILIFRRATAMAQDETTTQDGSEMDFLPRYNDFPDPNQSIRGYTSGRFMDEKPFKHHLLTYDDQARREVIGDDIVGPSIQRFVQKTRDEREAEARRKTQTIDALVNVAEKELQGVNDSLNVGFMTLQDDLQWKFLSMLADASEIHVEHYRGKQYSFVSLGHGDAFPREALTFDRPSGYSVAVPQPPVPQPYQEISTAQRVIATKPPPSTHPTRRSLRNLQPNGPVSTPQSQQTPPATTNPTPAPVATVSSGSGQALAPAPPRLAPAFSTQHSRKSRPAPIDTKSQNPTPPERSPVQTPSTQSQIQQSSGLPPIQPRQMSQTSLPPPPPPPHYGYPPQFSPTHAPPPQYAQHPHHNVPLAYPYPPQSSPYHHPQHGMPPSPYMQHNPQYHHYPPTYYPHQHPPPQQQYSFLPPQQGPAQSQAPPATRPHSRSQSNATPSTPTNTAPSQGLPPPPPQQSHHHQQQQNNEAYGQNGYHPHHRNPHQHQPQQHHHHRTLSHPHQIPPPHTFQQQPPPPPPSQTQPAPLPPHNPLPTPIHTTSTGKSRARAKAKQPVTFVNQTLATRKAAAEALAKEEAQAAAERKEKERVTRRDNISSGNGNGGPGTPGNSDGRKLAPKP